MKKIFVKIKNWFIRHKPSKRKVIQLYTALLYNANIKGFIKGEIFTGNSKVSCVPGLNCYSCPGAIGACPLGSLQGAVAKANKSLPFYVIGILLLYGLIFGRTICGWLCPVGLCQELAYKIKTPKVKKSKFTRLLSYLKYFILLIFVIIIPIVYRPYAVPGFCKFICPAGIFEGSFFIVGADHTFLSYLGAIFTWKFALFVTLFVLCIFFYRFFCRFICPLGAIYSLFNKFNILGVKVNKDTCIDCGLCVKECKMDIRHVGDHECINCGECIPVCPTKAIQWKGKKFELPPNEISINTQTEETTLEEPKKDGNKKFKLATQIGATVLLIGALVYGYFGDQESSQTSSNNSSNVVSNNSSNSSSVIIPTVAIENERCKNFEITAINKDKNFSIEEGKGKFTVLNFWYINCPGCLEELPYFEEFYQEYSEFANVIAINPIDSKDDAQAFIDEMDKGNLGYWIDWGLTFGVDNKKDDLPTYFNTKNAYPMTVFVDSEGIIKKIHRGPMNKAQLVDFYNQYK